MDLAGSVLIFGIRLGQLTILFAYRVGDKRATAIVKELNRVRSGRQITWGLIPRWSLGRLPCYDWVSGGIWPCSEVVVETHIGKSTSRLVHPRVYSPGKVGAIESIHSRLLPPSWFFAP